MDSYKWTIVGGLGTNVFTQIRESCKE